VLLTKDYAGDHIKKKDLSEACRTEGEVRSACKDLLGKPEGKRPLGRPRNRWEDDIKIDLQEVD
jgi:hypothetical protein